MSAPNAMDVALRTADNQNEKGLSGFSSRMKASVKDLGAVDSFRHTILTQVAAENYDRAIDEIKRFVTGKPEFPMFKGRAERYGTYSVDLINAIKVKRSFPGFENLAASKQQDMFDRAMEHFDDLKATLKKIEQIEQEVRIEDVRSTVMVVKALVYCVFALVVVAFVKELTRGVIPTAWNVMDHELNEATNFVFDKLGL